tara:strand:- start:17 stop:475 length:459 start_codon:yes stop_codon:yes gene_type:complete
MNSVLNLSIFCFIAFALLGSSIYTLANNNKNDKIIHFLSLLNYKQQEIYKNVAQERLNIYLQGFVLGLILGIIYLKINEKKNGNTYCIFVAIVLGVTYINYTLMPKSTYMLEHIKNGEQAKAWLEIYKHMKKNCYIGMILGVLALPIIVYIF